MSVVGVATGNGIICRKIIDFGVNYATSKYTTEKVKEILIKGFKFGVTHVLSISNSIAECERNIELSNEIPQLYFTVGCHPHYAKDYKINNQEFISNTLKHPKCFGIGECGLDFNRNFSSKEDQLKVFKLQLELAKTNNKKLYLHCRDAFPEFISILKEINYYDGLVHCFTGTLIQAQELVQLGLKLGITGWLLDNRRNHSLIEVISSNTIPLESFVIETDAPYMCIIKKKKVSYSEDLSLVVSRIAELRQIDEENCNNILYNTALHFLTSN